MLGISWTRLFNLLFFQEKYFWKIVCFCCTGLLLIQVFYDFYITKPTVSSAKRINLSNIYFPDIVICLDEDGFDKGKLKEYGYNHSAAYFLGTINGNFTGWSGIKNKDPLRQNSII